MSLSKAQQGYNNFSTVINKKCDKKCSRHLIIYEWGATTTRTVADYFVNKHTHDKNMFRIALGILTAKRRKYLS